MTAALPVNGGANEEIIFAPERDRTDEPLANVIVEFQLAAVRICARLWQAGERIVSAAWIFGRFQTPVAESHASGASAPDIYRQSAGEGFLVQIMPKIRLALEKSL